ncbi:MAG: hypothetical protein JO133_16135 [Burkholderiaceae bacterium]|nr:hypothetical protein [Burkholderiaceae bacterium]
MADSRPITNAVARGFAVAASVCVALSAVGIVLKHSAIPDNDMWIAYVDFYLNAASGNLSAWWAQLNEHRLVWSHLLYWIDLRFLHGTLWVTVGANFLAMAASWACFARLNRELAFDGHRTGESVVVSSLLAMLLFSYIQSGNIWSTFNIHFFLACLLPSLAFICLALAAPADDRTATGSRSWFAVAFLLGVASIGTMANGVLVLPIMVAMARMARQSALRVVVLAAAAALCLVAYFHNFQTVGGGAAESLRSVVHQPIRIAAFTLVFTGSAVGRVFHSALAAGLAGAAIIGVAVRIPIWWVMGRERRPLALALSALVCYVALSGAMAAPHRLRHGIEQAMTERYTTFSLYGLCAVVILLFARRPKQEKLGKASLAAVTLAAVVLCAVQLKAIGDRAYEKHRLAVAALALVLPTDQPPVDSYLYEFDPANLRSIAQRARKERISFFGRPPYSDVAQRLGSDRRELSLTRCDTKALVWSEIPDTKSVFAVSGSLGSSSTGTWRIWIADPADRLIGVALPGRPLPRDHDPWWLRESLNGFDGYAIASPAGATTWCESQRAADFW